ncbi:nucleotide exchange factor GrpE [Marinifilum caeruleilacunae]|uniref:Protein GrpE n=1 Tax=Marinifilum caeruleilacunae TaxID=2499076 RepID=A0ABX1WWH6_9BACT|nr:nucleotide exchange factor GrpE [Marinifilum caeruleilacunae]NOU60479.1 nucleotide exchange factor GrpE [Marinifilum caeruleilacunae]
MTKDTSKSKKEELEEKDLETNVEQPVEEKEMKEEAKAEKKKEKKKSAKEKKADELEELGLKLQDINDKYMRLSAEFDNYRKRTLKEKMDLTKSAGEKILVNVLPVMDNFERALQSIDDAKDVEALKEGVHLIYNNFKEFISQNGVKEIEAINKEFDTDIHEAITKIPAPSDDLKGKVVDCVEKGYTLNEKVIRFSKVVVGE